MEILHPEVEVAALSSGKLNSVETLRGVAAILVVTVHAGIILATPNSYGHLPFGGFWLFGRAGVDFFFVLSGFIITYIHFGDIGRPEIFRSFWAKRLLRIYPAYWILTALFLALLAASPTVDRAERNPLHVLFSFFLLPEAIAPILDVGWSLRHELLFYALFSVALLHRRLGMAVLLAWGGGIAWNMAVQLATGTPYFAGLAGTLVFRGFNIEFFFGIATALLLRSGQIWRPAVLALSGGVLFLATGMWESFGHPLMHEWPVRHVAYALGAALILYGVATLDRTRRTHIPGLGLRLGSASYSIYLIHVPVILVLAFGLRFARQVAAIPAELAFIGLIIGAVAAGVVFSEAIEQPMLRFGRRWMTSTGRSRSAAV